MILHPASRIQEYTAQGWWGTTTLDELFRRRNDTHLGMRSFLASPVGRRAPRSPMRG